MMAVQRVYFACSVGSTRVHLLASEAVEEFLRLALEICESARKVRRAQQRLKPVSVLFEAPTLPQPLRRPIGLFSTGASSTTKPVARSGALRAALVPTQRRQGYSGRP